MYEIKDYKTMFVTLLYYLLVIFLINITSFVFENVSILNVIYLLNQIV